MDLGKKTKKELVEIIEGLQEDVATLKEDKEVSTTYMGRKMHPSTASRFTMKLNKAHLDRKKASEDKE